MVGTSQPQTVLYLTDEEDAGEDLRPRAELAGVSSAPERWRAVSDYARRFFPTTGMAFADVHAARVDDRVLLIERALHVGHRQAERRETRLRHLDVDALGLVAPELDAAPESIVDAVESPPIDADPAETAVITGLVNTYR